MIHDRYFAHHGIGPASYARYRLPGYLRDVLPSDRSAPILDIGCGLGQTLIRIREAGYLDLEGIDVSSEAVEACRQSGLTITRTDVLSYRPTRRFRLAIMSHVLEHIDKPRIIPALTHIREHILTPGGALLVAAPNAHSNTGCYWAYEDFTHTTLFTAGSLLYVLRAAGFSSIALLDPHGVRDSAWWVRLAKLALLRVYRARMGFWNLVTASATHAPSPVIHTFDLKALASQGG